MNYAQADIPAGANACSARNRILRVNTSIKTGAAPVLLILSMALLVLGCADDGIVGQLAKLSWLASALVLAFTDIGGAFGVYVASVAIFSPRPLGSLRSLLDRPDNFALLFIVLGLTFIALKRAQTPASKRFTILAGIFMAYGLLQMLVLGVATRSEMGWFFRAYGAFGLAALLWLGAPGLKDLRRFAAVITMLGGYMATVSLLEAAGLYSWIIPRWIAGPNPYGDINNAAAAGRAGGLFMQSEFNGAALGLICCIIVATRKLGGIRSTIAKGIVLLLCLAAIYFTYTRGAWLAISAGIVILTIPGLSSGRDMRKTIVQLVAALLVITVLAIIPNPQASERLGNSENAYFRLNVWWAGLKMAAERPLFGYGYGQFASNVASYHDNVGTVPYKALDSEGTVAHNVFVNLLVEEGAVGLVLYIILVLILYRDSSKSASRAWCNEGGFAVAALCITYYINMQFISGYEATSNLMLFGSMGMIAGLVESRPRSHAEL